MQCSHDLEGIIPPKFVVEKVLSQMRDFIAKPIQENVLYASFVEKLESVKKVDEKQKEAFFQKVQEELKNTVYPAYEKMIHYFESLKPKAPTETGAWTFPNDIDYYAYLLRIHTT